MPRLHIATCPLVENGVIRVMDLPMDGRRCAIGLDLVRRQLALAVKHGGTLGTFDRGMSFDAVRGAKPKHLRVL